MAYFSTSLSGRARPRIISNKVSRWRVEQDMTGGSASTATFVAE